jgi:hypothetical protein
MSGPALYASDRKNTSELRAIGERKGWKPRKEISAAELRGFSSLEMQFHEMFSAEAVTYALEEPARKAKARKQELTDIWTARDLGEGKYEAIRKAGTRFTDRYPQYIQDTVNSDAISSYIQANGLDLTEVESFETAFQALAARGDLHLNPSALGLGDETRISGHQVKTHPQLHLLLRPALTPEQLESYKSAKMSSKEYLAAHPELRDQRTPHYIVERLNRAAASFVSMEPSFVADEDSINALTAWIKEKGYEFNHNSLLEGFRTLYDSGTIGRRRDAVVHGQVLTMTEYPLQQRTPPVSDKYSFQKTIDSMSSEEYKERMLNDKAFRAAVDAM